MAPEINPIRFLDKVRTPLPVNPLVTVAIPAHNKPDLLMEAIGSVINQSYPNWELVILDDGSNPPIDIRPIKAMVGNKLVYLRNEQAQGVVKAKNKTWAEARGDLLLHLDDDDLLSVTALERIVSAFRIYPQLDCVFLNVEVFGQCREGSKKNQDKALAKVLALTSPREMDGLSFFDERLFLGMLQSVPIPFQRSVIRRYVLDAMGGQREELFFGEVEWALRLSLLCRAALVNDKLSHWRVDGQNTASRPEMVFKGKQTVIDSRRFVLEFVLENFPDTKNLIRALHTSLSDAYFDRAFSYVAENRTSMALTDLWRSFRFAAHPRQAKLLTRALLTRLGLLGRS